MLSHRLILAPEARSAGLSGLDLVQRGGREDAGPGLATMLTARGRLALALGGGALRRRLGVRLAAAYPVAVGLVLAVALAWAWVRVLDRPMTLRRVAWGRRARRGRRRARRPRARARRRGARRRRSRSSTGSSGLGERRGDRCTGRGAAARPARYVLPARAARPLPVRRRRAPCSRTRSGSSGARSPLPARGALLVYPRLVAARRAVQRGRARTRRTAGGCCSGARRGFDLHSVREYEQGESLRKVHWPTHGAARAADGQGPRGRAARRGRGAARRRGRARRRRAAGLELRHAGAGGRLDPAGARAPRPAGSPRRQLGGCARRSRCAPRTPTGATRSSCSRRSSRPGDAPPRRSSARTPARPRARSSSTVVTAAAHAGARRPARRSARSNRRGVSLVYVDPPSFAGARGRPPSRRCCGSRRRASRSPSSGAATTWREARRPALRGSREWLGRSLLYAVPGAAHRDRLAAARGGPRRDGRGVLARACSRSLPALVPPLAGAARSPPSRRARRHRASPSTCRCSTPGRSTTRDFFGPLARPAVGTASSAFYDVSVPFLPAEEPRDARGARCSPSSRSASPSALGARRAAAAARRGCRSSPAPAGPRRSRRPATSAAARSFSRRRSCSWRGAARACRTGLRPAARSRGPSLVARRARARPASPAVAKSEFLAWRTGTRTTEPDGPGRRPLRLERELRRHHVPGEADDGADRPRARSGRIYWRATTLDVFDGDRWVEDCAPIHGSSTARRSAGRPAPARRGRAIATTGAAPTSRWRRSATRHLAGPSVARRATTARDAAPSSYDAGGVAVLAGGLERGDRYTRLGYAPQPTPRPARALAADRAYAEHAPAPLPRARAGRAPCCRSASPDREARLAAPC